MEPIRVKKLKENAIMPTYGSAEAAGADLYACLCEPVTIAPGESVEVLAGHYGDTARIVRIGWKGQ